VLAELAVPGSVSRDLGGLPTMWGRPLRSGLLYRTAAGHERVPGLVQQAAARPPVWFADLRQDREIHDETGVPPGVRVIRAPLHDPEFTQIERGRRQPVDYAAHYVRLLTGAAQVAGEVIRLTASRSWPIVIGCRAGKDRTGVVVITLLWALGVTHAAIVDDYLRSAQPAGAAPAAAGHTPGVLVPVTRMLWPADPAKLLQVSQACLDQARTEVTHG
jgi:protein-tyrosine phosphatase